jgi:hypothetical protein
MLKGNSIRMDLFEPKQFRTVLRKPTEDVPAPGARYCDERQSAGVPVHGRASSPSRILERKGGKRGSSVLGYFTKMGIPFGSFGALGRMLAGWQAFKAGFRTIRDSGPKFGPADFPETLAMKMMDHKTRSVL